MEDMSTITIKDFSREFEIEVFDTTYNVIATGKVENTYKGNNLVGTVLTALDLEAYDEKGDDAPDYVYDMIDEYIQIYISI
jgi:hypothetical protein